MLWLLFSVARPEVPMPWPLARKVSSFFASETTEASPSSSPSTRFAFRLYQQLAGDDTPNVFFSPSSVMLCLAMVHELASGETRQAMEKTLEIADLDPAGVQLAIASLKAAFRPRPNVTVTDANSLWCADGAHVLPELAARLRDVYDAELTTLDFGAADAVPRINAWVSSKTNGMIGHILDRLSPQAILVAINAVYFKGRWTTPFLRTGTRDGPFTTATGEKKQLPMMLQSGRYRYYEAGRLQAVALPYEGGMAMYVVLPSERSDLRQFRRSLTSGLWESWLAEFNFMPGTIVLPRFKLDYLAGLERALTALGMERAFDRERAEFAGIQTAQPRVWIDQVLHRAVAEVNEEGTEAAAATAVVMRATSMLPARPPRQFEMIVDHPFLVVIREEATGAILFMGWVGDPE
jgi:serine protease inhibitor